MIRSLASRLVVAPVLILACGSNTVDPPASDSGASCSPPVDGSAPTYSELFDLYFGPGTPGHCATAHCHANPGFNVWLCGDDEETCYGGMLQIGLIDPKHPRASTIASPTKSPLSWVNPSGDMPFDATGPLDAARDAITAWVDACAPEK
jgi:hypothetical protein